MRVENGSGKPAPQVLQERSEAFTFLDREVVGRETRMIGLTEDVTEMCDLVGPPPRRARAYDGEKL